MQCLRHGTHVTGVALAPESSAPNSSGWSMWYVPAPPHIHRRGNRATREQEGVGVGKHCATDRTQTAPTPVPTARRRFWPSTPAPLPVPEQRSRTVGSQCRGWRHFLWRQLSMRQQPVHPGHSIATRRTLRGQIECAGRGICSIGRKYCEKRQQRGCQSKPHRVRVHLGEFSEVAARESTWTISLLVCQDGKILSDWDGE